MKRVAAIVLGVAVFAAACAGGQISAENAPPNNGSLATVWVGARLVALYYGGGGEGPNWVVKTFDLATKVWKTQPKDAFPNPPVLIRRSAPALFGAGDLAVVLNEGQSGVYDGATDRWSLIPGPGMGERTEVMTLGDWLLAHERADGGPVVSGAALFDPVARHWIRVASGPAAPGARLAPVLFVRDTLVVLPGSDNPIGADYPGAFWRVGSPAWQTMSSQDMPDARGYDWSQAVAADAGGLLLVRGDATRFVLVDPGRKQAFLYDAAEPALAPTPLDASSLPAEASYTIRKWTGRCLLVWGAVEHHADPDSCRGAQVPCDPASSVEYGKTGFVWCPEVKGPAK